MSYLCNTQNLYSYKYIGIHVVLYMSYHVAQVKISVTVNVLTIILMFLLIIYCVMHCLHEKYLYEPPLLSILSYNKLINVVFLQINLQKICKYDHATIVPNV